MDKKQLSKLIGQLSSDALRVYTEVFLEENPKIAEQFCKFIDRQLSAVGVSNAEIEVENAFKATTNVGDRWHSYWVQDWGSISEDSGKLFARAQDAISAGNPDIALAIGVRCTPNSSLTQHLMPTNAILTPMCVLISKRSRNCLKELPQPKR